MQANVSDIPAGHFSSKPLWGAITVLGVAVIALGASLIHVQTRPVDGHAVFAAPDTPTVPAASRQTPSEAQLPVTAVAADEAVLPLEPAAPAAATPSANIAPTVPSPRPVPAPAPVTRLMPPVAAPPVAAAPAVAYPPAITTAPAPAPYVVSESGLIASRSMPLPAAGTRAICTTCGRIVSVTPVQRKGETNGTGALAGGVLGAVVGNQIGGGNGRAIATILGAVGGGVAGNAIEKSMQPVTIYLVQVRMDDGSVRTIEQARPLALGSAVFVQGQTLRMADGAATPFVESHNRATPVPPSPQAKIYITDRN